MNRKPRVRRNGYTYGFPWTVTHGEWTIQCRTWEDAVNRAMAANRREADYQQQIRTLGIPNIR